METNKTYQDIVAQYDSNIELGLTSAEALIRTEKYGTNELTEKKKSPFIIKFLSQFVDFLIIILMIAAVLPIIVDLEHWLAGDWVETLIIAIVILINAILGAVQESKAEKSLDALKKLSTPHSKVIRDGQLKTIESRELVPGDIFIVEAGDFIPADARLISATNLLVDESALTGESVPVQKSTLPINTENPSLGDMHNALFSSTYVSYGKGTAIVVKTGMNTEIGKIADALMQSEDETTPLQKKLNQIGKVIGYMCIAVCVIVFALRMIENYKDGLQNGWIDALKNAIALAVAAIPEGLATVVTVVLAIGVEKMAKQQAIIKKLPAVETLGCASIICSDKTGTLTQNKMTVVKVYHDQLKDISSNLTSSESQMIEYFALCCDAKRVTVEGTVRDIGDPTEIALLVAKEKFVEKPEYNNVNRIADLPFDSDRKLMTVILPYQNRYLVITKGAPDIIISKSLPSKSLALALQANEQMASLALRVLGVGYKIIDRIPEDLTPENVENDLTFLGLVGMIDPARPEVKDAIKVATTAGIRTIMITGDHVATAKAIAKELHILRAGDMAISSKELSKLSDDELFANIEKYSVYARVAPEDKVRIVTAWQKKGCIVAMTGDGVNDSPALKKADIGCAMGITGTDVAKEAADVVLVNDNFSTIVSAVKEGRGIYANIRKVVQYLLSSNIGEVLTIFLASLISLITIYDFDTPLVATHLLWINLITDSLPAFALGTERSEPEVMNEKPRAKTESFFSKGLGLNIVWQGVMIGVLTLIAYSIGQFMGTGSYADKHLLGQTMAFLTLSSAQLFHAFNLKSQHSIFHKSTLNNKFLIGAFFVGMTLQIVLCYVPGLNSAFNLFAPDITHLLISLGLGASTIVIVELYKLFSRLGRKKN